MRSRVRGVGCCLASFAILCGVAEPARAFDPPAGEPTAAAKPPTPVKAAEPEEFASGRVVFRQSKIEERIRKALDEPVSEVIFSDTQLRDVASQFSLAHKIPITIDGEALGADGKNEELELTIMIPEGTSLRAALRSALNPRGLTYAIENDQLLFTTAVAAELKTPTRVYQVHDLVFTGGPIADFERLIELITSLIGPESWREAGGTQGAIVPYRGDGVLALVITQTEAVHEQVESMLTDIRDARDLKVRELQRKQIARRDAAAVQAEAARAALAAASGGDDRLNLPTPPSAGDLVTASNRFGLRLYRELLSTRTPNDNIVVSPIGAVAALGPVYAGAAGATAREFQTGLGFPPVAQFQTQFADLLRWMNDPTVLRNYRLRSRSHLFVQPDLLLKAGFVDRVRRGFDVTPVPLDFALRTADAKGTVRRTSEADSDGFLDIGELMQALTADTRLAVVNTVDFRGRWTRPFPISATTVQPFHSPNGPKPTNMMTTIEELDYFESEELQMVRKPYDGVRDAGRTSLYMLLPVNRPDALTKLEAELTAEKLTMHIAASTSDRVQLHLPRFTFDDTLRQTKPLQQLGLKRAFGADADFSLIDGSHELRLSTVEQRAKIEVNETETRAAATTIATMRFDGGLDHTQAEIPKLMRCDRPFLFVLRDDTTGAILFLGRLAQPQKP